MADQDRLLYFNLRARGEPTRMVYALAGKPLTDDTIKLEEWPKVKADQPLDQLPVFTCSEGTLVMSNTIARYAAKKCGLAGSSLWEETLSDMIVETCSNYFEPVGTKIASWKFLKRVPEPENSEKVVEEVKEGLLKAINYLQKVAEKRGNKFLISDKILLGDIWFYSSLEFATFAFPDIMEITPWVKEFVSKFQSDEKMKKYLAGRPDAPM